MGVKCGEYWCRETPGSIELEDLIISTPTIVQENLLFRESMITIHDKKGNQILRKIRHFFVYNWIDRASVGPSKTKFLLDLIQQMSKERTKLPERPILVHCSAGIGRTGTLLTLCEIYKDVQRFKETKGTVGMFPLSVYDHVYRLRHMRPLLVQNVEQYLFIYKFVKNFFD